MSNSYFDKAAITVSFKAPGVAKEWHVQRTLDPRYCHEALAALPRDREISFMPLAAIQAQRQMRLRRELAQSLSRELAEMIIVAIEKQDPHFGYSPEEWAKINQYHDYRGI